MSSAPLRQLRRVLAPVAVTLVVLATFATAGTASAAPSQPAGAAAQPAPAVPVTVGPGAPPGPSMAGAGLAAAAAGGGCTPTINVSSCIDVSGVLPQVDFYLNTLAGLPAGSRYDVLFVDEIGGLAVVKKGILDHAGHYGPWAVNDGLWAYCAVVVSDPLGGVVYYVAFSPWGHV